MTDELRAMMRSRVIESTTASSSMVLTGEMGVGKSHLLAESVAELRRLGWVCTQIWANPAAATIPFGALAPFAQGQEGGDRLAMLRSTVAALSALGEGRPHVIAIDDAPLLDDQSIAVLHQLCTEASIPLLATARSTDEEREPLTSLWKVVEATRLVIDPLDEGEAAQLASTQLELAPDNETVTKIVQRSGGNPLFIGELVRAELDGSTGGLTPRLRDVVGARISRLDDASRHQLLLVAVADPLDTDLDVTDHDAIVRLEAAGLVGTDEDGDAVLARPAHPLYGEIVRDRLSALERKTVARELAVAMQHRVTVRRGDALRLAGWLRACGDEPSAELAVPAALEAISLLDADLANELVDIAVSVDPDFDACFAAGEIARLTGDVERALTWFERAFSIAAEDAEIRSVALAMGQLHGFYRGEPDDAVRVLGIAVDKMTDPARKLELDSERSMFAAMLGRYEDVIVSAGRVLAHPDSDEATCWTACTNLSWAEAQLVDLRNVHEHLDRAIAVVDSVAPERAGEVDLVHAVRVNAQMEEGNLVAAVDCAHEILGGLAAERGVPTGLTTFSLGQVEWIRGATAAAVRHHESALEQLGAFDSYNALPFVRGAAAILAVVSGDTNEAHAQIDAALERGGGDGMWDRIWLGRARAWLAVAAGDMEDAIELSVAAGDVGIDTTHLGWGLLALHDALAWGGVDQVADRMAGLRKRIHAAPLFELLADNAATLAARDVEATEAGIARLRGFGATWHAGVVSAGLALVHADVGREIDACRHATAARLWMSASCVQHPMVHANSLSTARLSVVAEAWAGSTSREIAEASFLSIRTVDNHLGAAYAALGVSGRGELASLFAIGDHVS